MSFIGDIFTGTKRSRSQTQRQFTDPFGFNIQAGGTQLTGGERGGQIDVDLRGLSDPLGLRSRFVEGTGDLMSQARQPSGIGQELLQDFTGGTRDLLGRFRDGREGFVESQVNPLIRQLQPIPEQTARDFARRGIAGSLPRSVVARQEQDVGRQIAEARAQAEAQAVGIESGLLDNFMRARQSALQERASNLGLQGQQLDRFLQASQSALQEELSKLGLSADVANAIASTRQIAGVESTGKTTDPGQGLVNIGKFLVASSEAAPSFADVFSFGG